MRRTSSIGFGNGGSSPVPSRGGASEAGRFEARTSARNRSRSALSRAASAAIDATGATADVNDLLAALLGELLATLEIFAAQGFAAIRPEWLARHAWQDARVSLATDFAPPREGICRGVDSDGALLLEVDGRIERILSGEVSLRPCPHPPPDLSLEG